MPLTAGRRLAVLGVAALVTTGSLAAAVVSSSRAGRESGEPPAVGRPAPQPTGAPVVRQAAFALGSYVQIAAAGPGAQQAVGRALAEVERLDAMLDRFDPKSAISRVNAQAGEAPVEVPEELGQLTQLAIEIARRTGGAFDPTVGPLVDVWGFGESYDARRPDRPPAREDVARARKLVDYRHVDVRHEGARWWIGLDQPGMALDLGGIAQGYGADRAAAVLKEAGIESALVDAGGEIRAIGGRPAGSGFDPGAAPGAGLSAGPASNPWRIGIQNPRAPDRLLTTVWLSGRAVATSGDYERYFVHDGQRFSHLIDPRTGWPQQHVAQVSVIADSAAVADALATAVAVVGPQGAERLLAGWPGSEAILVDRDLNVARVRGSRP